MKTENKIKKQKIKVALLLPSLAPAGPILFTQNLISKLKDKVEYIEVFYFKTVSNPVDLGIKCTKLNFCNRKSFSDFDIVHSTMAVPDLYAAINVDYKKWIVSMHNYIETDTEMQKKPIKAFLIINIWKWALHRCRNIIVSSVAMLNYYKKIIGDKNYELIPYGIENREWKEIDENDLKKIKKIKDNGYIILGSSGNFIPRKGFSQLVEVLKSNNKYALLLIGDGPERKKIIELCKTNKLEDRICFPGYRENSYNYYKYMDIYTHVSYSEGFGLAMLEALAKGLPLVCSNLDIYNEYFTNEDVCFFQPGDIQSLNNAINTATEKKKYYSERSILIFEKYFDLNKMAELHIDFYLKILNQCQYHE